MPEGFGHADLAARAWVVAHRFRLLDDPMRVLTTIGRGGMLFIAIAAAIAIWRRRTRDFLVTAVAILLTATVVDHVVKPIVGRERPFVASPSPPVIGDRPDDFSFPSGHAGNAFAGAFTLARAAPEGAPLWWALAVAVAYSRVYVGVHYPGDVVAGALIGILIAWAVSAAMRAWRPTN